jgi:hypothetical protein
MAALPVPLPIQPQGVQPRGVQPRGVQPKGVQPRGVQPRGAAFRPCSVVKPMPANVAVAYLHAPSTNPLEAAPQPFSGKKRAPIVKPPVQKPKRAIADISRDIPQDARDELNELYDTEPELQQYEENQKTSEHTDPYELQTRLYTPQTRQRFQSFVDNEYDHFKLPTEIKKLDEDACSRMGASAEAGVQSFLYQQFIREYIRNESPYRGILVYHGLGSGKTCSAIAAAEALYGMANKKIIVMTPGSLQSNFISEISFCGFKHFNVTNHWTSIPLEENGPSYLYAQHILSLTDAFLKKVMQREEERRMIWIPDFTQPPNYTTLDQQERNDIQEQLNVTIQSRITFIRYNGIKAKDLKRYACEIQPDGTRFFDNAVIVIDEIHNLTRLMHGKVIPFIKDRKRGRRKIPAEPIVPGKWVPGLCNEPHNYTRAYLFYKLLSDARNSKIIGLSGTPIINFPDELGILATMLSGYIECVRFILNTTDRAQLDRLYALANEEPRIDIIRFYPKSQMNEVLLSVFPEGYKKVFKVASDASAASAGPIDQDGNIAGVSYDKDAQEDIRSIFARLKIKLQAASLPIGPEEFVSHPRLPIDDEEFKNIFVNPDLTVKNELVLKKRLTGLISYYQGSKEEYMPRVIRDEIVTCAMSDHTLGLYSKERVNEIQGEMKKKDSEKGDLFSAVEVLAKMSNPSSYRFRSRAFCNFTFPEGMERPFPGSQKIIDEIDLPQEDAEEEVAAEDEDVIDVDDLEQVAAPLEAAPLEAEAPVAAEAPVEAEAPVTMASVGGADENKSVVPSVPRSRVPIRRSVAPAAPVASSAAPSESVVAPSESVVAPSESVVAPSESVVAPSESVAVPPESVPASVAAPVAALVAPSVAPSKPRAPIKKSIPNPFASVALPIEEPLEQKEEVAPSKPVALDVKQYREQITDIMTELNDRRDEFLLVGKRDDYGEDQLKNYSSKMDKMIRNLRKSKGSNLVYSQFKTVEGLGVFGIALKANGYHEITIEGSDDNPRFSSDTEASLLQGPTQKRFILFTGDGSKERRTLILNVFNGNFDKLPEQLRKPLEQYNERRNFYGEICWVIGITGAGAEGISLKCCRSVHIMEPYWNNVRLEQVKGRAIRICSHKDLPYKEREVEIYTYYTIFSKDQLEENRVDRTIRTADGTETSDQNVYNVSVKKDKINNAFLQVMKEAAVDCNLNAADNKDVACLNIVGSMNTYLFDPDLATDIITTPIQFKEEKKVVEKPGVPAKKGEVVRKTVDQVDIQQIKIKGTPYPICIKPGSGGTIYNIYGTDPRKDYYRLIALGEIPSIGEIQCNPMYRNTATPFKDASIRWL